MAYNEQYYADKKARLEEKRRINLQGFINATFNFTNEAAYLDKEYKMVEEEEKESKQMTNDVKESKK